MNRSALRRLSACLLIAMATSTARADEATPDEAPARVELRFGWEPGLELVVTGTRRRVRTAGETETRSSSSGYRLRVETEGENLRVQFTDPEFDASGGMADSPEEKAKLLARVGELMPDFLVSQEGVFVGIHDLPGFQKKFADFLAEIMPTDPDGKGDAEAAAISRMQAMLTSEEFLNARAAEEWNAIVGAWSGANFEVGVPEEFSRGEPVAAFSGKEIRMNYAFAAEKTFDCQRGGVDRRCAVLVMRSESDPEDTKRLIESLLQGLAPGLPPQTPMFRSLAVENVLRITTEPAGLVPHDYSLTKQLTGVIVTPDGDLPIEQIDETRVRYSSP